jgi:hypothetical protein
MRSERSEIAASAGRRRLEAFAVALTLAAFGAPQFACADQAPAPAGQGCAALGWPLAREDGWFADSRLPHRVSGARLRRIDRAVQLDLQPDDKLQFFLSPAKPLRTGGYGGLVTFFGVPRPALYQVTLSDAADVDLFENGARIRPEATERASDCPGAAFSARFSLAPGDLVLLQISNASHPTIKAAFAESPK